MNLLRLLERPLLLTPDMTPEARLQADRDKRAASFEVQDYARRRAASKKGWAALRATRSHASHEARSGLRPTGFDRAQEGGA
jgi:hypothetical protein